MLVKSKATVGKSMTLRLVVGSPTLMRAYSYSFIAEHTLELCQGN
jgi:hypothetical protein